jgi:hypothetical protein
MVRYSYIFLDSWGHRAISLSVGVVSTCTGVTWARYGRVIYRAKEPTEFWRDVVVCYLWFLFHRILLV